MQAALQICALTYIHSALQARNPEVYFKSRIENKRKIAKVHWSLNCLHPRESRNAKFFNSIDLELPISNREPTGRKVTFAEGVLISPCPVKDESSLDADSSPKHSYFTRFITEKQWRTAVLALEDTEVYAPSIRTMYRRYELASRNPLLLSGSCQGVSDS